MGRLTIVALVVAALVPAGAANAGCWATAGIKPLPEGVAPGETWTVDVRVLQHGVRPLPDATPTVTIVNAKTSERRTFRATAADPARGLFRADVVFPSPGAWSVAVDDGFPGGQCAQTHTFGTYAIGAGAAASPPSSESSSPSSARAARAASAAGSFPVWPVATGLALALVAIGRALAVRRSRTAPTAQ